ncbi:MAG TPA: hypothetical protein VMT52_04580 [Planctomycetota bacterium]|nr:hypothetical protein [Planctomycetota bacterium]
MAKRLVLGLKLLSLVLLCVIGVEVRSLIQAKAPLEDLEPGPGSGDATLTSVPSAATSTAEKAAGGDAAAVSLPERHGVIETSGIFGLQPKKEVPIALLGIVGKYAIIQGLDGKKDLVSEGGRLGNITLLRIGTNRVVIEHQGKQQEMTLFSGLGSSPLLPAPKDAQGKDKGP